MLTKEQLAHLESESQEDGATMILCSELRELVAAYRRLEEIHKSWNLHNADDWSDLDPSERPRF